ncbi:136_t:CDS:2 [Funneliformis geosporum]|uniref:11111_t:CDS:1 n=1 Tax=Funneliformis geosporum TaxID=1117311 RepID=A0A9W4SHX5_9GLOM|nr:136_t:CDS:2 [Funneliformis geosporum]CAI2169136.1 11111_t:CDS:2 [Funneliformis geosporum]
MVCLKLFTFIALVAFFVTLAESAPAKTCPFSPEDLKDDGSEIKTFIVALKSPSDPNEAAKVEKKHFDILKECGDKTIINLLEEIVNGLIELLPVVKQDDKKILNFTTKGLIIYSGRFTQNFVDNHLSKLEEIFIIQKDIKYKLDDDVFKKIDRISIPTLQSGDKTSLINLDRVDERNFPLDGKYQSPEGECKGANVYVLDTGINTLHLDFGGRAKFAAAFCDGCKKVDDNGHGTMVAGIIGGKKFGIAKLVKLFAVKVLNSKGTGFMLDLLLAIQFVIHEHFASENEKTIINMSLGFTKLVPIVDLTIKNAHNQGIISVVAAGNDAQNACNFSPSATKEAITVGATELKNDEITSFSNFGKCVDIFAPGRDIESDLHFLPVGSQTASGTSFSAPHVAGAIACIIAKEDLTPDQAAKKLYERSTQKTVKGIDSDTPNKFLFVKGSGPEKP